MSAEQTSFNFEQNRKGDVCAHCGAKILEYRHSLGTGLIAGLIAIYKVRESKLEDLHLTLSQSNNFQKLRYWGLVEKGRSGVWTITERGREFVEGHTRISQIVRTFRGKRQGYEGELISFSEVSDYNYRQLSDYRSDALRHE